MTTRRVNAKVDVPIPSSTTSNKTHSSTTTSMDFTPKSQSPYLPTPLEAAFLAIYPGTLILGSLFSTLHPSSRAATYSASLQSYTPATAPSYFARKSNVFNQYFVKIGWFWITLAFLLLLLSHSSLGPPLTLKVTKRRLQALLRYATISAVWLLVTQWCFGPPIIDRGFRWTGGQCSVIYGDSAQAEAQRAEMSDVREVLTHAACKAVGGQWAGGHDISGHVFLLILGSAMLWLELLPAVLRMEGLREARKIRTADGLVRSASVETEARRRGNMEVPQELGIGVKAALSVALLSWWMLLMTAAYFHTWFEKFTGLLVAFTAIYAVYFLPRAVPAVRKVVGMPGV